MGIMVVEKSLHPPMLITDPSEQGIRRAMRSYRGCVRTKPLEIGTHDVTDHRWDLPTHHWIVQVMADRTAELRILPKERNGRVADVHAGQDRMTVRYPINRNSRSALLGGETIFRLGTHAAGLGPVLFKIIEFEPKG